MACDLHVHTRASDGLLTPGEVVAKARELGLEAVAITDHDTTAGIGPALEAARALSIRVIPGIEISTHWQDEKEVHILGYFLDHTQSSLQSELARRREGRVERARKIVKRLAELGLEVSWESVTRFAGDAALGRPHIALAMIERGYVGSIGEAFERFLNHGAPAYVPRMPLAPQQAIKIIRDAGGAPVLAHPGLLKKREVLDELLQAGLVGLEVFYPDHDAAQEAWLWEAAGEKGLIATGGSDFHGQPGEGYAGLGARGVSWETVIALQKAAVYIRTGQAVGA